MLPAQTIEILKKLDKKELKKLGDFLSSPYFNQSELILKIFEAVKKEHPDFTGSSLEPARIFKKLYPSEIFKETRIQNLYADFGRLLREFLGHQRLKNFPDDLNVYIAEELTEKSLNILSNKFTNKSIAESDDGMLSESKRFHNLYRSNYVIIHNLNFLRMQGSDEELQTRRNHNELLLVFFLRDLLSAGITTSGHKKLFISEKANTLNKVFESINIENLIEYLEKNGNKNASYLKVFYYLYYYTENSITPEQYLILKKELLKIIYKVPKNDALVFIITTIQIILAQLIKVTRNYYAEIFELSKLFTALNIFPNDVLRNLAIGTFRDIFTVAVIQKEFDWAEKFISDYSVYLLDELRENELNYCMGILNFKKNNFNSSLEYFNKVQMMDIIEKLNIRFYYLMNYIELRAYENALSALNTIRQFYQDRKDEIPEMFAVLIPDALKYFGEIIKCEEQGIKLDELIYDEAKSIKRYYHVNYILKKMEKLKE